jgi:hypothetical protein
MIVDLTGVAIRELLANAGVTAIAGQKVRPEFASNEAPPAVIVEGLTIGYSLGPGTRNLGIQTPMFVAKCYGANRVQASQLANAVVEAINMRGPRTDSSGRLVYASLVETGGDPDVDPVTGWPHSDVVFRLIGAQKAVA